jgi:hypothetical protein
MPVTSHQDKPRKVSQRLIVQIDDFSAMRLTSGWRQIVGAKQTMDMCMEELDIPEIFSSFSNRFL